MRGLSFRSLIALAAGAALVGCQSSSPSGRGNSGSVPLLTADAATAAGLSAEQVADGSTLYAAKCAKCHKFYNPADYSQQEWGMWMRKMSRKSKLTPPQEDLLTRYLAAFRQTHP